MSENKLAFLISLSNTDTLHFSSFNPPIVKSGTLESLMEYSFSSHATKNFVDTFVFSFQVFSDPFQVLRLIEHHYSTGSFKVKDMVVDFLVRWLSTRTYLPCQFDDLDLMEKIFEFNRNFLKKCKDSSYIEHLLLTSDFSVPLLYPRKLVEDVDLLSFDPKKLSVYLNRIDSFLFISVEVTELCSPHNLQFSPNLHRFKNFSSQVLISFFLLFNFLFLFSFFLIFSFYFYF